MTHISIRILVLLSLLPFVSCNTGTSPEEDSCSKGRQTTNVPFTLLTSSEPELYVQTGAPVDINCHGKFWATIAYKGNLRLDAAAPFPPVDVDFGTTFILGAGFTIQTVKDSLRDMTTGEWAYYWTLRADQGAKNLNDEQDWHYTMFFFLQDNTKEVFISNGSIDYKAKVKR